MPTQSNHLNHLNTHSRHHLILLLASITNYTHSLTHSLTPSHDTCALLASCYSAMLPTTGGAPSWSATTSTSMFDSLPPSHTCTPLAPVADDNIRNCRRFSVVDETLFCKTPHATARQHLQQHVAREIDEVTALAYGSGLGAASYHSYLTLLLQLLVDDNQKQHQSAADLSAISMERMSLSLSHQLCHRCA
jgi:hypothetical protein